MARPFHRFRQFLAELKRRSVYRVAATYTVVAFVVWQAASLLFPALAFPGWTVDFVIVLTLLGFPVALVLAWAFEMTPGGMRRTRRSGSRDETDRNTPETTSPSQPRAGERSIAVLPFRSLAKGEPGAFGEGMHDALLTRLSNVADLKVISRTSVQQYRETEKTTAEIARELGVTWVVEGGVQEIQDRIQVNAQLIDPRTDTHRWARSYRRDLTTGDLFDLQSDLTKEIARALETELSPEEQSRVERRPTGSLDAYRLYIEGRQQLGRRSFDFEPGKTVREAAESFQRAIDRDREFALAWAGLADARAVHRRMLKWTDAMADPEAAERVGLAAPSLSELPEPKEAARRALELDPDVAEAHASMGFVHVQDMNAPAAARELHRAVDLQPSYWEAHHWLGELYLRIGQPQRALDHITLATELNPRHALARHWLYDAYLAAGQAEESLREARRQREMGLEENLAVMGEVRALIGLGRLEEAREIAEARVSEVGAKTVWGGWFRSYLVQILAGRNETTRAREYVRELEGADAPSSMLAWALAGLDEGDAAVRTYREMDREARGLVGVSHPVRYPGSVGLAALKDASGYGKLMRLMNEDWKLDPDGRLRGASRDEQVVGCTGGHR